MLPVGGLLVLRYRQSFCEQRLDPFNVYRPAPESGRVAADAAASAAIARRHSSCQSAGNSTIVKQAQYITWGNLQQNDGVFVKPPVAGSLNDSAVDCRQNDRAFFVAESCCCCCGGGVDDVDVLL
jgi:hypothetical protein